MSGMIAILAGFFVVGCEETPTDVVDDRPDAPTNLEAVSLSATSVGLRWVGAVPVGSHYHVSWTNATGTSIGEKEVEEAVSTTIEGLVAGTEYTFTVVFENAAGDQSLATTINWAPANRYTEDAQAGGILRIYAKSVSGKGSGIVIQQTGAYNALTSAAGGADLPRIHLIADVGATTIKIGAPKSFTDFTQVANFRDDVQISDAVDTEVDAATGLNGWYRSASLESLFATNNVGQFTIPDQTATGKGAAFAARWGTAGSYRYARVYIVPKNNKFVQLDNNNDPFIEVQISYQPTAGIPFAK